MEMTTPKISILMVGYKSSRFFPEFWKSLIEQDEISLMHDVELLIYDSTISYCEYSNYLSFSDLHNYKEGEHGEEHIFAEIVKFSYPSLISLTERQKGGLSYTQAINFLASQAQGDYLFILNPDTKFTYHKCIYRLLDLMDSQPKAAATNLLVSTQGFPKSNGGSNHVNILGGFGSGINPNVNNHCVLTLTGTAFVIRKSIWESYYHGFNELFEMYGEETELSLRMAMHDEVVFGGYQTIWHEGAGSQSVKLKQFSPYRRYLTLRNNALMWGMHAKNLFWGLYILRLLLIPVEYVALCFMGYPYRVTFPTYWKAFKDAITMLPKFRKTSTRQSFKLSEFQFLRRWLRLTFK